MTGNAAWLGHSLRCAVRRRSSPATTSKEACAGLPHSLLGHVVSLTRPPRPSATTVAARPLGLSGRLASRSARWRQIGEKLALNSIAALARSFRGDALEHPVKIVVRSKARELPHALHAERRSREHLFRTLDAQIANIELERYLSRRLNSREK